jgi:flagellar protein FlaG
MTIPIASTAAKIADPVLPRSPPPQRAPAPAKSSSVGSGAGQSEALRRQELESELAAANQKLASDGHEMRFEYDREASRLIVRLVDSGTREILRQFPSDEALHAARQIKSGKSLFNMRA